MDLDFGLHSESAVHFCLRQTSPVRWRYYFSSESNIVTLIRPEILRMSELQDSSEIQTYSSAVLYILSAITPPPEFVEPFTETFIEAVKSSPVCYRIPMFLGSLLIRSLVLAYPPQSDSGPFSLVLPQSSQFI